MVEVIKPRQRLSAEPRLVTPLEPKVGDDASSAAMPIQPELPPATPVRPQLQDPASRQRTNAGSALQAKLQDSLPLLPQSFSVQEAADFLRKSKPPSTLNTMTLDERRAFRAVVQDVVEQNDGAMLQHHEGWHETFPLTFEPGSGERFLGMHRSMVRAVETRVGGDWRMPEYDARFPIPSDLEPFEGDRATDFPAVGQPAWLRADGKALGVVSPQIESYGALDGKRFQSLNDFKDLDSLGRAINNSGYHGSVHSAVGGVMAGFRSPLDPIFFGWHGHIDKVVDRWLATKSGRDWAAANPTHPILNRDTPMSAYM